MCTCKTDILRNSASAASIEFIAVADKTASLGNLVVERIQQPHRRISKLQSHSSALLEEACEARRIQHAKYFLCGGIEQPAHAFKRGGFTEERAFWRRRHRTRSLPHLQSQPYPYHSDPDLPFAHTRHTRRILPDASPCLRKHHHRQQATFLSSTFRRGTSSVVRLVRSPFTNHGTNRVRACALDRGRVRISSAGRDLWNEERTVRTSGEIARGMCKPIVRVSDAEVEGL